MLININLQLNGIWPKKLVHISIGASIRWESAEVHVTFGIIFFEVL